MAATKYISVGLVLLAAVALLGWLGTSQEPILAGNKSGVLPSIAAPFRIALVPERDIFVQRRRYARVADYLTTQLHQPVEIVTVRSYHDVLQEFRDRRVEGAFLGSLVTVLAADEVGAKIVVRPELAGEVSSYRGVIFVPDTSPIRSVEGLVGKSIAMVPTTTGANLFPVAEFVKRKMTGASLPHIVFVGTHDDVILEVLDGHADAGAVKDLRLDEYEKTNPTVHFRRLAVSRPVPENALVVRSDLPQAFVGRLSNLMLTMNESDAGRAALQGFGASRFIPCTIADYGAVYDLTEQVGPAWSWVDPSHPAPRRPSTMTMNDPQ